jgi:hypothetical protein
VFGEMGERKQAQHEHQIRPDRNLFLIWSADMLSVPKWEYKARNMFENLTGAALGLDLWAAQAVRQVWASFPHRIANGSHPGSDPVSGFRMGASFYAGAVTVKEHPPEGERISGT